MCVLIWTLQIWKEKKKRWVTECSWWDLSRLRQITQPFFQNRIVLHNLTNSVWLLSRRQMLDSHRCRGLNLNCQLFAKSKQSKRMTLISSIFHWNIKWRWKFASWSFKDAYICWVVVILNVHINSSVNVKSIHLHSINHSIAWIWSIFGISFEYDATPPNDDREQSLLYCKFRKKNC